MTFEGSLRTQMWPWHILRAVAAEDDAAAISLTSGNTYNQNKSNCIDLYDLFGDLFAGIIIAMYGDDLGGNSVANDDAFGFDLVGYRMPKKSLDISINPAILICNADANAAIVGTQEMSPDGGTTKTANWVDTITLTKGNIAWPGTLNIFDNASNRIALLCFDGCGIRYLYPYVHGADGGQAGETPGVGMIITAY